MDNATRGENRPPFVAVFSAGQFWIGAAQRALATSATPERHGAKAVDPDSTFGKAPVPP
jgi:hypothetical protein